MSDEKADPRRMGARARRCRLKGGGTVALSGVVALALLASPARGRSALEGDLKLSLESGTGYDDNVFWRVEDDPAYHYPGAESQVGPYPDVADGFTTLTPGVEGVLWLAERHRLELSLGMDFRWYFEQEWAAHAVGRVGYAVRLWKLLWLKVGGEGQWLDRARYRFERHVRGGADVGAAWTHPTRYSLGLRVGAWMRRYLDPAREVGGTTQHDLEHFVDLSAAWGVHRRVDLVGGYRFGWMESSHSNHSYRRHLGRLGVRVRLPWRLQVSVSAMFGRVDLPQYTLPVVLQGGGRGGVETSEVYPESVLEGTEGTTPETPVDPGAPSGTDLPDAADTPEAQPSAGAELPTAARVDVLEAETRIGESTLLGQQSAPRRDLVLKSLAQVTWKASEHLHVWARYSVLGVWGEWAEQRWTAHRQQFLVGLSVRWTGKRRDERVVEVPVLEDDRDADGKQLVTFTLRAPEARRVSVVGTFNQWDAARGEMRRLTGDRWRASLRLSPGRYLYTYLVDGKALPAPPDARRVVSDGFGSKNGVLIVQ